MNSKTKLMMAGIALVSAAAAAGATWYFTASTAPRARGAAAEPVTEHKPAKYVTLDNVIVMLRRAPNESEAHYLSASLVVATSEDKAKEAKEHLPLLRSLTVQELSHLTLASAADMTAPQLTTQLNKTFDARYAEERRDKPFSAVMLGKLIVE